MQASTTTSFLNLIALLMMHAINFLHVLLIWDISSQVCALSGHNSFGNHIQNAQYDYKTKLELEFLLIRNSFL